MADPLTTLEGELRERARTCLDTDASTQLHAAASAVRAAADNLALAGRLIERAAASEISFAGGLDRPPVMN